MAEERQRWLGHLHSVAWEGIPRWRPANPATSAWTERSCVLRHAVVRESAALLQRIFPGAQWLSVTGVECVSCIMGTMDSSAVSLYIRCTQLNAGWADASSGSKDDAALRELIPCIHEAVVREWEDCQRSYCSVAKRPRGCH